jgi:hypothetical protein
MTDHLGQSGARRLYQCPGCWAYDLITWLSPLRGDVECSCGERMTCVDLRDEPTTRGRGEP